MGGIRKFKVFVPVLLCTVLVFTLFQESFAEEYQQQNQDYQPQSYSTPSSPTYSQNHHSSASYQNRNNHHPTRNGGYPTESRTVVPLVFPMIVFVGVVLLVFFAVVGSAAVIGSATSAIGRHDGPPHSHHRFAFAREFSSSAALARDVLSSEECVERVSCEVFRLAKGFKAQNWILRALDFLPAHNNLTKRASRTIWRQSKSSRTQRSGKSRPAGGCQEFQCGAVKSLAETVKRLRGN